MTTARGFLSRRSHSWPSSLRENVGSAVVVRNEQHNVLLPADARGKCPGCGPLMRPDVRLSVIWSVMMVGPERPSWRAALCAVLARPCGCSFSWGTEIPRRCEAPVPGL